MSESSSQAPAAAEPGPTAGTPAGVTETVAPAASSTETVADASPAATETAPEVVVAETPAVEAEREPSLLSDAKTEEVKEVPKEEAKEASKAEEPKEEPSKEEAKEAPKAEEPKVEEVKEEPKPLPIPTYEKFTAPEGLTLDEGKLGEFTSILGEYENKIVTDPAQAHAVIQEMGQKMVDLYVQEARDTADRYTRLQRDNWDRTIESWRTEFREDPEIGVNRADTSLARMGGLLEMYGQTAGGERLSKLRDVLTFTGAGDNPEVLRFVNWAASKLVETAKPVAAIGPRATAPTSRAQRLYRNSTGAA